jgi:20S proteasome subunit beta 7
MHSGRASLFWALLIFVCGLTQTLSLDSAGVRRKSGVVARDQEEKKEAESIDSIMASFGMNPRGAGSGANGVQDARQRTQQPIVTGTTILGLKYKDGVMLAADTLASYGSMARYKDVRRIKTVGDNTIIGASGEMSDFQAVMNKLENMDLEDMNSDDGYKRSPSEVFNFLRAVMYQRRNKGDPLWNQLLVAGHKNDAPFLGYVDLIGTAYEENFIATGFGAYLAMPLIRERWSADMEEGEARGLLEDCLRVLYYRDCRATYRIQIAKATAEGTLVSEPYEISHDWETATYESRHATAAAGDGSSW